MPTQQNRMPAHELGGHVIARAKQGRDGGVQRARPSPNAHAKHWEMPPWSSYSWLTAAMAIISGEICLQLPRLSPLRAKRRLKWRQMMVERVFRVTIWSRGQRSWISQSCVRFFDSSSYDVECVGCKKLLNSLAHEFLDFNFASSCVCG